jgi:ribosome biogenesis GTPase / thiamine phosphate phosphatase
LDALHASTDASTEENEQLDSLPVIDETDGELLTQNPYADDRLQGVVIRKSTGTYHVRTLDGQTIVCGISNRLRKVLVYPSRDPSSLGYFKVVDVDDIEVIDPVAVGDDVVYIDTNPGEGQIKAVLPQRSKLTRRAAGSKSKPMEQVIVANADQVITVMSATQPKPQWTLLDRYLAGAESCAIPAVVCITKIDLVRGKRAEAEVLHEANGYAKLGYTVLLTSSYTGENIDTLREVLKDKTSVIIGKSGVGKSSLLNALQPGLGLRVNEINTNYGKGRHTTTHLEMHMLDFGGAVVDTPGIKIFGLWNVEPEDIGLFYRDFQPYLGTCKFGASCEHDHEPGCAIKKAVEHGEISKRRYESYLYVRRYFEQEDK